MHASDKTKTLEELAAVLETARAEGKKIVHCHGVFDLLHIGHIKHLQAARSLGDLLVVTVTPDRLVNKGPHRPAFTDELRLEALGALECVDYVSVNRWATAVEPIRLLKPDVYVKGGVAEQGPRDHTDAIVLEEEAVKAVGGVLHLTGEDTFSASTLINRYLDVLTPEARLFLEGFRTEFPEEKIVGYLKAVADLKVLVVGEAIIDEYCFCHVMNKANKDPILAAKHLRTEEYAGGALAVANHLANFAGSVTMVTFLGDRNTREDFVRTQLNPAVELRYVTKADSPTIVKRRFLEDYLSTKLLEVDEINDELLGPEAETQLCALLEELLPQFDVVAVVDFGHGLCTPKAISLICGKARFLAVNAQTNASNYGFNVISKYPRADLAVIDESEAQLEMRTRKANIDELPAMLAKKMSCRQFMITRGRNGTLVYDGEQGLFKTPVLSVQLVDRTGAGDACLAFSAPCAAMGVPAQALGFIANVAGAEACAIMGNASAIDQASLFRHISSLLK